MGGRPHRRDGWIVLVDRLAAYVELDGAVLRPHVAYWVDAAGETGLGLQLAASADALPLADGYPLARSAAAGPPTRVRCRDAATAAALRRALPSGIPVELAEGDERARLDALAERLGAAAADELGIGASLRAGDDHDDDATAGFHAAAAALHAAVRVAPPPRAFAIALALPPAAAPTAVLVTVGGHLVLGEPDLAGVEPGPLPDGAGPTGRHGMLAFLGPADLGDDGWAAADAAGWRLPGTDAAPDLFHVDDDGVVRPLGADDVARATAAALAIAARLREGAGARG